MAAQFVTPEAVNFMAAHGRGPHLPVASPSERAEELRLHPMTRNNQSRFGTAFTVSIEAREGVTTGISAADRARTIQVAIDPRSRAEDLVQPGHVFPLIAQAGRRAGPRRARPKRRSTWPAWPASSRRGHLRDHERRRHHGPRARPRPVLRAPRPQDGHGGRPHPLPAAQREARPAGGRGAACPRSSATSWPTATRACSTASSTWRW